MTATVAERARGQGVTLPSVVEPEDAAHVHAFLSEYPEILGLLDEAAERIPLALPTSRPIELQVSPDRETGGDEALFAVVSTELAPEEARPLMGRFLREWLLDAVRRGGGRFNVVLRSVEGCSLGREGATAAA